MFKETPDFLDGFYDGLLNEENLRRNKEYELGWRSGRHKMMSRINKTLFYKSLPKLQAA